MNVQMQICPNCFFAPYDGGRCPQCGYSATDSHLTAVALPPGAVLDERYLLGRVLGIGGFGMTYLALDTVTQTKIAIKEYFPSSLAVREENGIMKFNGKGDSRVFDHGMRAFIREAKSLHKFVGEDNIVQVSHAFYENGTAYFVMEYLNGINLKVLRKGMGGKVPFVFAYSILLTLTKTLSKIHAAGLLHRDVSPENIFITKDGNIKIIDFGATRYYLGDESRSLAIVLKPGFAPPEQYTSKGEQGPWTDVYALAATFYNFASGSMIPEAPDRLAGKQVQPLHEIVPEVDGRFSAVIERALSLSHKKRYQNMDEFENALRKYGPGGLNDKAPLVAEGTAGAGPDIPIAETGVEEDARRDPDSVSQVSRSKPGARPEDPALVRLAKRAVHRFRISATPFIGIASGNQKGEKWAIPYNTEIRIGRMAGANHIVIADTAVSREHCIVRYDQKNGIFFVKDISSNGTFYETGGRFEKGRDIVLVPGSGFYLAPGRLLIRIGLE